MINGKETPVTLVEINKQQELTVKKHKASGVRGVICDTGGVVLEVWSEEKFGERINCKELVPTDLYIYCKTLPRWQADPLRLMPNYMDRTMYELKFDAKLKMGGGRLVSKQWTELRLDLAVKQIKSMLNE